MSGDTTDDLIARPGQLLHEHLINVATRTEAFAARFDAGPWGRVCGLLHDIGKASPLFQQRVRGETDRKVDHSTAGARHAAAGWKGVGRLLAYCIAGHHSGLPDGQSNDESSLAHRLDPARRRIEDCSAWRACLEGLTEPAPPDAGAWPFDTRPDGLGFRLAFFVRMLFSCLVDADRLDAEAAGDANSLARADRRKGYPGLDVLTRRLDAFMHEKQLAAKNSQVNRIRAEVLAACREAAMLAPGLFSLPVPTGGGKTLSSLAFALDHAQRHGLSRVVYVIPYTSIIEQNARVFREALGDAGGEFVVEHHSNLLPPEKSGGEDSAQVDDRPHPATENWDAPVIVTTAVQFFESLFSHKAGRCRKLHNLAKSVIILDETQMLPLPYLLPCLDALRELTATYGASVVLCTATQPALNAPENGAEGLKGGLTGVREIMHSPVELHNSLRRVEVQYIGEVKDAELVELLSRDSQALCIVPTRRQARRLFDSLRSVIPGPVGLFHLSALMCPQHRTATLDRIRLALAEGRPCRVVSTTLVEAGVDVDFPVVYRAEGGIDSIAQAAGRCNREGLRERGEVYVFRPEGGLPPGHFRRTAQAGRSVMDRHQDDLLHPDAVRDYFLELYWQAGPGSLDEKDILERLTSDAKHCWFPFREIGQKFQFIEEATQALVIPYDAKGRELERALDALQSGDRAGGLLRRAQRHTVSLYTRDMDRLERAGAVRRTGPGGRAAGQFFVLSNPGLYSPEVGLDVFRDDPGVQSPENLMA